MSPRPRLLRLPAVALLTVSAVLVAGCHDGGPATTESFETEGMAFRERGRRHFAAPVATPLDTVADIAGRATFERRGAAPIGDTGSQALSYRQVVEGIPIEGSYLQVVMRDGAARAASFQLYPAAAVDVTPTVTLASALDAAGASLRIPGDFSLEGELVIRELRGALALGYAISVSESTARVERRAFVFANGPRAGRVRVEDDRIELDGEVVGPVAVRGAPGETGTQVEEVRFPDVFVQGPEGDVAVTGADGGFSLPQLDSATPLACGRRDDAGGICATTIAGPLAHVVDEAGVSVGWEVEGGRVRLVAADALALAQLTTFYWSNEVYAYLERQAAQHELDLSPVIEAGGPLEIRTNMFETCNAFFSGSARTINFFQAGDGCGNTAEDSIIAHEYGHFLDWAYGGIVDGGLSEGWGDTLSCFVLDDPRVGRDLIADGDPATALRVCDNDYRFPASGADAVHELGQAWSGFAWHTLEALGRERAEALIWPALTSGAPDIPSAVLEVFLRNGPLEESTPGYPELLSAAQRHGLGHVVFIDVEPPAAPVLAIERTDIATVTLTWDAPPDDSGSLSHYELRRSSGPIGADDFLSAELVDAPPALAPGTPQSVTVVQAPGQTFHYALRAVDGAGNEGLVSESLAATTETGEVVFSAGAEANEAAWQTTGLWHRSQTDVTGGEAAFWYGVEGTGTFDTNPDPNAGELVSPVVDLRDVARPVLVFDELLDVEAVPDFDRADVVVEAVDESGTPTGVRRTVAKDATDMVWRTRYIPLDGFGGGRVRLRFTFDSIDASSNEGRGWFVDRIAVLGETGRPAVKLMINEVLADPPAGYDANGDGDADIRDDEFIELLNAGGAAIDLSGFTVEDAFAVRHTFAPGTTLGAGRVLVLFGGGSAPANPAFDAVISARRLQLNNDGDSLRIRDRSGTVVAEMIYGAEANGDASLTRERDGDLLAPFVRHVLLDGRVATPGLRTDETPFPRPGTVIIHEVFPTPETGVEAEFVELYNPGTTPVGLEGWSLTDEVGNGGIFAAGITIPAGDILLIPYDFSSSLQDNYRPGGRRRLSLNDVGDRIVIRDPAGAIVTQMAYQRREVTRGESLVRAALGDPDAPFVSGPPTPGER